MHFILLRHLHLENTNFISLVFLSGGDKLHDVTLLERSIENSVIHDNSPERVEHAVEDQRLQRLVRISCRRRNAVHNCFEHLVNSKSCSRARVENFFSLAADEVYYLIFYFLNHRTIHVDLVDDWNNLEVIVDGEVEIADCLGLDALRSVYEQQAAFAGG